MKLCTRVYDGLEGKEPFEVQDIREGVKIELYYMNDFPAYLEEYTRKGNFAIFPTRDGLTYRLLIEKGYYDVMHELYDVETNTIWEQFWVDVNKCRTNYLFKILVPVLVVYLALSYLIIALSNGNIWALLGCVFVVFLVTGLLNNWNRQKMQKINYEAGNKIREAKGAKHFDELSKAQERYYAKYFGYEEDLKQEVLEQESSFDEVDEIEEAAEANQYNEEEETIQDDIGENNLENDEEKEVK